jgi:hypothetical protein
MPEEGPGPLTSKGEAAINPYSIWPRVRIRLGVPVLPRAVGPQPPQPCTAARALGLADVTD